MKQTETAATNNTAASLTVEEARWLISRYNTKLLRPYVVGKVFRRHNSVAGLMREFTVTGIARFNDMQFAMKGTTVKGISYTTTICIDREQLAQLMAVGSVCFDFENVGQVEKETYTLTDL